VFVKVKANQIDRYSNYKKFSSEIKLGVSTPAPDAAAPSAPAPSAPAPSAPAPSSSTPKTPH
jgi:hypothetical protein